MGGLGMILAGIRAVRDKDPIARVLVVWFGVSLIGALVIPLDWQRYYLPWLLPLIVLTGYAPITLLAEVRRIRDSRQKAILQASMLIG